MLLVSPHFQRLKTKRLTDDEVSMKTMIECIFVVKSCVLYLSLFPHFSILFILFFPFLNKEICKTKTVNKMSAREWAL